MKTQIQAGPGGCSPASWRAVFEDDFGVWPVGRQIVPHGGIRRIGPWETRNLDYLWDCGHYDQQTQVWEIARGAEGKSCLAQPGENFAAFLVRFDGEWADGFFEARFAFEKRERILGSSFGANHDQLRGLSGLVARYRTQRAHLFWGADREGTPFLARRDGEEHAVLWRGSMPVGEGEFHDWGLVMEGPRLVLFLDGREVGRAADPAGAPPGTVGFRTDRPFRVVKAGLRAAPGAARRAPRAASPALKNPPREWRVLERDGLWHWTRAADLNGDGRIELLHVGLPLPTGDSAGPPPVELLDAEGRALWRRGEFPPADRAAEALRGPRLGGIAAAFLEPGPDGARAIALAKGGRVEILDARDGRLLRAADLPACPGPDGRAAGPMAINCLIAARLETNGPERLLAMSMECLLALDLELNPLWRHTAGNLGHQACVGDVDGDGRAEVVAGYQLLDSSGRPRWTVPGRQTRVNSDMEDAHNDMTVIGRFRPGDPPRIAMAASQSGFYLLEADGSIVARHLVGHAQQAVPGRYDPDTADVQFLVPSLWESSGIFARIGADGALLNTWELGCFSSATALRWAGRRGDLALLKDLDCRPALFDGTGGMLWHAPVPDGPRWKRLPVVGVDTFPHEGAEGFFANFGRRLILYAP